MNKKKLHALSDYAGLLGDIKGRIQQAQTRAMLAANAELVRLYWDVGGLIVERQQREGWGAAVIPRLARDLQNDLPEVKGFSQRNIGRMIAFYHGYPQPDFSLQAVAKPNRSTILPQAVAKLAGEAVVPQAVAQPPKSLLWLIPWGHHAVLLEKVKNIDDRLWYTRPTRRRLA